MIDLVSAITIAGLLLDVAGATLVLAPGLPAFMTALRRFRWFRSLEEAKVKLYHEGRLERGDVGFGHIAKALEYETNLTNRSDEQFTQDGGGELHIEVNGQRKTVKEPGYNLVGVERVMDPGVYPDRLSLEDRRPPVIETVFALDYQPAVVDRSDVPELAREHVPTLVAHFPPGQLPRAVQDHEERLVFRIGGVLLAVGFLLQIIATVIDSIA